MKSKPGSTTRYSSPENEYVGIVETTTQREEAIPILTTFDEGGLPHESFVSSWNPVTFKEEMLHDEFRWIATGTANQIADATAYSQYERK
jgi:hypothetical protein